MEPPRGERLRATEPTNVADKDVSDRDVSDTMEVVRLMEDPKTPEADILASLQNVAESYSVHEVFAIMARFDTPEILG